jgi:ATPase subunit of ABC transporter with duplicated ATPase domains
MGLFDEIQKALKEAAEEAQGRPQPSALSEEELLEQEAAARARMQAMAKKKKQKQREKLEAAQQAATTKPPTTVQPPPPTRERQQQLTARNLRKRLQHPAALREAILWQEVLGPPVALRGRSALQHRFGR